MLPDDSYLNLNIKLILMLDYKPSEQILGFRTSLDLETQKKLVQKLVILGLYLSALPPLHRLKNKKAKTQQSLPNPSWNH